MELRTLDIILEIGYKENCLIIAYFIQKLNILLFKTCSTFRGSMVPICLGIPKADIVLYIFVICEISKFTNVSSYTAVYNVKSSSRVNPSNKKS